MAGRTGQAAIVRYYRRLPAICAEMGVWLSGAMLSVPMFSVGLRLEMRGAPWWLWSLVMGFGVGVGVGALYVVLRSARQVLTVARPALEVHGTTLSWPLQGKTYCLDLADVRKVDSEINTDNSWQYVVVDLHPPAWLRHGISVRGRIRIDMTHVPDDLGAVVEVIRAAAAGGDIPRLEKSCTERMSRARVYGRLVLVLGLSAAAAIGITALHTGHTLAGTAGWRLAALTLSFAVGAIGVLCAIGQSFVGERLGLICERIACLAGVTGFPLFFAGLTGEMLPG